MKYLFDEPSDTSPYKHPVIEESDLANDSAENNLKPSGRTTNRISKRLVTRSNYGLLTPHDRFVEREFSHYMFQFLWFFKTTPFH